MSRTRAIALALALAGCGGSPRITPDSLPEGVVGKPYRAEIGVDRGTGPIEVLGVGSGSLPPGLALHFTNGDSHGVIEGTPKEPGIRSFQIGVWFQGSKSVGPRVVRDYQIVVR